LVDRPPILKTTGYVETDTYVSSYTLISESKTINSATDVIFSGILPKIPCAGFSTPGADVASRD
jgi:hypothetical protein